MGPGIGVDDASAWARSSAVMPVRSRRILGLLTDRPTKAVEGPGRSGPNFMPWTRAPVWVRSGVGGPSAGVLACPDAPRGGTGLGLAPVRRPAHAGGGEG